MKQLFCVIYILMFLVCSQTHLHSLYLFLLFWRANQLKSENRRRFTFYVLRFTFVSLVGHKRYFMGVSCKVEYLRGDSRPVLPLRDQPALFRPREGRCSRYGGALFFSHTDFSTGSIPRVTIDFNLSRKVSKFIPNQLI